MTDETIADGFWSYAQSDDVREGGRIRNLATLISNEFETLTGNRIHIFVDRDEIKWGQDYRKRLDEALQRTTFFIPILTPTYFMRPECRREMRDFVASANRLGLQDLILSIRYVPMSDLRDDSPDELKAIAASMQYEVWEELRLEGEDSPKYRGAVSKLANRLVDLTLTLEKRPTEVVAHTAVSAPGHGRGAHEDPAPGLLADAEADAPGVMEHLAAMPQVTKSVVKTMGQFPKALGDFSAVLGKATERMSAADSKPNPFAARLVIAREAAVKLEQPVARIERLSKDYLAGIMSLDPIFQTLLEWAPTADADGDAMGIEELVKASQAMSASIRDTEQIAKKYEGMSRDLRPLFRRFQVALRGILDAQALIDSWATSVDDVSTSGA